MQQPNFFRHRVSKKSAHRGFTLIEVILAIAILGFVLCGILAAYISCAVLVATSKNVNIATNAVNTERSPFLSVGIHAVT